MERIGIDYVGPMKTTEDGKNFILVAIDHLTKFVFLRPSVTKTPEAISDSICEDMILHHGCPSIIQSDNGLEFNNKLISKLCDE